MTCSSVVGGAPFFVGLSGCRNGRDVGRARFFFFFGGALCFLHHPCRKI